MKSYEYQDKLRRLDWLRGIRKEYRVHLDTIEAGGKFFTVEAIHYSCRGPGDPMNLNPHRPIKARYIYDALTVAVGELDQEIAALESELKSVTVEL